VKKILVVDNEEDVIEVLRLVLGKHGYQVLAATSGMDGLTHAQSELPDLIMLDIMMQQMDGWEVLKLLKLDDRTAAIPVVMLSARVEPKDKVRGLQEGAVDYVTKPFAVREILEKVAAALGGGGEGGAAGEVGAAGESGPAGESGAP
jgi:DNA-binding response OmpR family regulator